MEVGLGPGVLDVGPAERPEPVERVVLVDGVEPLAEPGELALGHRRQQVVVVGHVGVQRRVR